MTPSDLKLNYKNAAKTTNSHAYYFERKTMKHWGDTMSNYKVVELENHYKLIRKCPVKGGLQEPAYFEKITFRYVKRIESNTTQST